MSNHSGQLVYTVKEAAFKLRIGRDLVYRAIREGRLIAKKDGRRTLITAASIDAYIEQLPELAPEDLAARRPIAKRKSVSAAA